MVGSQQRATDNFSGKSVILSAELASAAAKLAVIEKQPFFI